ncbi:MAG TPA: ferritin family protein [Acidobacteriota bacterium]|nr:ferritin family protein [Acidobacteriota bacterium]
MSEAKQHVAEVLRRAIKGEVDGHRFYKLLAEKAANADAKRKLEGLRDDEFRHRQTLHGLFEKHVGGDVGRLPDEGISVLSEIFSKGQLHESRTEMEYISLAIEAELAATKYYQQERDLIDDPSFKAVFDELAEEEHSHFQLLQAEKDALGGNYSWFGYEEGAPLED